MEYSVNMGQEQSMLIPVETFLHRIFPAGVYESDKHRIVDEKIFKPRKDCQGFNIEVPVDWEAKDRSSDRNWRMQLQGWTMFHPIMNFFDSYENKEGVIEYFIGVARDWYSAYGDDPNDVVTTRMPSSYAWYDMSVGFRALVLAFMINRIDYFSLSIAESDFYLLKKLAIKHIENLAAETTFSLNNHGIFQIHGLLALLVVTEAKENDPKRKYALARMEELVASQFDVNGFHLEHSPHYHFYVLSTFLAVVKSGWYCGSALIDERISRGESCKKWLVDPLKRPVCIGDSILTVQDSVEFSEDEVCERYRVSDFHDSGYGVVRSSWKESPANSSMLFLMAAYHSKSHKHRDCMSFEWFDGGDKIICDSGKYGYRSDKYRNYFLSSKAHNSVEIEGFDILKLKPYGSALRSIEEVANDIFRIDAKLDYPAIKHARSVYFKPKSWVIVVDDLKFARERSFTQWFHLDKRFGISSLRKNSVKCVDCDGKNLIIDCLSEKVSPSLHSGDDVAMQGFISENDYQFSSAIALGYSGFGDDERVVTSLAVDEESREDAMAFIASYIEASLVRQSSLLDAGANRNILPNVRHRVYFNTSDYTRETGEFTTRIYHNNVPLTFFSSCESGNEKLIIMLPGATKRSKGEIDFQRYSWVRDFKGFDVIVFSDPTIKETNDLSIGWFQNSERAYGIDALAEFIKFLIARGYYRPEDVVVFGSSAGGFAGLKLANELPDSPVLAINPQLYLYRYTASHFNAMLSACYSGLDRAEALRKYSARFTVDIDSGTRRSPTYIFQNTYDTAHLNRHLKPMLESYSGKLYEVEYGESIVGDSGLNIIYYSDRELGHSPPSKEITIEMIKSALQVLGKSW